MDLVGKYDFCSNKTNEVALRIFYTMCLSVLIPLGAVSGLLGLLSRQIGVSLRKEDFTHLRGNAPEKQLNADRVFSTALWNANLQSGGMSRSHGGMIEPNHRIDGFSRIDDIISELERTDPDVLSIFEMQDVNTLYRLIDQMKDRYAHFYIHNGTSAYKSCSGILVASKFPIRDYSFIRYKDAIGSARWINKGFATFALESQGQKFARIYATHLQHGNPDEAAPTRKKQVDQFLSHAQSIQPQEQVPIFLFADANIDKDKDEYQHSPLSTQFQHGYTGDTPTCTNHFEAELWNGEEKEERVDYLSLLTRLSDKTELPVDHVQMNVQLHRAFDLKDPQFRPRSDHHLLFGHLRI